MIPVRNRSTRFLAAALALTLILAVVPAFAIEIPADTVAQHVTVLGTDPVLDLFGMTTETARAAVLVSCAVPTLAPLALDAAGTTRTLDVASHVRLDADAMVAAALAATETTVIAPIWVAADDRVHEYVDVLAGAVHVDPVNAHRKIVKSRLKVDREVDGVSVDTTAAVTTISAAITAELAAGGSAQATVTVPVTAVLAKVRSSNIGKTILVVLHERYVYLYKGAKLEKKYRCAIGMRSYPTPRGLFKVIKKNPHPSWGNPYSAWSKSMPAYIRPGYYNPLGLRALYINSPGIRIHGTAKTWSMGHAASHGCIRLTNHNIVDLYPRVAVGTPVYILK